MAYPISTFIDKMHSAAHGTDTIMFLISKSDSIFSIENVNKYFTNPLSKREKESNPVSKHLYFSAEKAKQFPLIFKILIFSNEN